MQPLESFRGSDDQDVVSWLTDIDELFDAAKQKPEERLSIAPTYLADDAKKWYRIRGLFDSWLDFKTALESAFTSSANQLKTSAQLYNRRQALDEPIQTYYFDVMRLCTRLNPEMPPNERLLHLLRGLKPSLAQTIIMFNPRDCSDLLEQGKRAEAAAFISQTTASSPHTNEGVLSETSAAIQTQTNARIRSNPPEEPPSWSNSTSEHDLCPYPARSPDSSSYAHPPGRSSTRPRYSAHFGDSFYRGQAAYNQPHTRTRYPNNSSLAPLPSLMNQQHYRNRNQSSIVRFNSSCYNCGGHGHLARDCPTPRDRLNF